MKKILFSICFILSLATRLSSQDLAADMQWRVQGTDTLPAWVMSPMNPYVELGVSEPGLSLTRARSQSVAHAAFCHMLHDGLDARCVEEIFSDVTAGTEGRTEIRRLVRAEIDYPFRYQVLDEHVSVFGEIFRRVEIIPDTTSACRIQGNVELFFTYKFNGSTGWSSYYDLDLNVTGLDSVSHIALKTHRVQDQIEYHSWLDGIPFERQGLVDVVEQVNETPVSVGHGGNGLGQVLGDGFLQQMPVDFLADDAFVPLASPKEEVKHQSDHWQKDEHQYPCQGFDRIAVVHHDDNNRTDDDDPQHGVEGGRRHFFYQDVPFHKGPRIAHRKCNENAGRGQESPHK